MIKEEIKQILAKSRQRRDAIIIKHIKENPFCLQDAFRLASAEIGVHPSQVCTRYYRYIRDTTECFSLHTEHGIYINTKTIRPKKNE